MIDGMRWGVLRPNYTTTQPKNKKIKFLPCLAGRWLINTRTLINQINPSTLSPYPHIHTSTSTHPHIIRPSVRPPCLFVPHLPSSSSSLSPPSLPLSLPFPVYSVININIINDIINGNYDDELRRNIDNQSKNADQKLSLPLPLICLFILPYQPPILKTNEWTNKIDKTNQLC